jgi:hypothetical protein
LGEFPNPPKSIANSSGIAWFWFGTAANQTYGSCVDMAVPAANTTATNSTVHVGNLVCEISMEASMPGEILSLEAPFLE